MPAVLREVRDLLDPTAVTVTGRPLVDYLDAAPIWDPEVIRLRGQPLLNEGGIAVLRGNLAPAGAIIKPAAASPQLIQHRGRALVFDSIEDVHTHIDDPDLDVDATPCWCFAAVGRGLSRDAGSLEHATAEEAA